MSLRLQVNESLKSFNSFGVNVRASLFAEAHSDDDVREALLYSKDRNLPLLVIGGGSNLLLTKDVLALVLRMATQGIRPIEDDGQRVVVEAEAGEVWHVFVLWTLEKGLSGLENLSLIPGTVGAAPVQNIGAYGVEIKDVFAGLTALDRQTGELRQFTLAECNFGYRDSVFKQQEGRWLILRVRFILSHITNLNLEYGSVRLRLSEQGIEQPTAKDVGSAISSMRSEKLPDPAVLGNAGSFFKNPVVSAALAAELKLAHPGIIIYPQADKRAKLAAGWLIDAAAWKGFREADAGVHRLQSLVLVNYGSATGQQLLSLARRIQADIEQRFTVQLEIELSLY